MPFICDCHVHVYPNYNLDVLFSSIVKNLTEITSRDSKKRELQRAIILTERHDCNFFQKLSKSKVLGRLSASQRDEHCLEVSYAEEKILVFSGRQIVTCEKLELLAFTTDAAIADGLPFIQAKKEIEHHGGLLVINWAPGKWLFERGKIIQKILEEAVPGELLFCDTTLRPPLWLEPDIMRKAKKLGFGVVAGSDPLPQPGEEIKTGSYGIFLDEEIDTSSPTAALRKLLKEKFPRFKVVGQRSGNVEAPRRVLTHMLSKRYAHE